MTFASLHRPGAPFVLPNAWDVGSARALVAAGFPAIGTTSLGITASSGLPDATRDGRDLTVDSTRQLLAAGLGCYLTCDIEDGFAEDPSMVADFVEPLGVDGVNLEDATDGDLVSPTVHAAKIVAVKSRTPNVFLNARTDVFWLGSRDVNEAVRRARTYVDAGADGVFIPGTADLSTIESVVRAVNVPVNVLASPTATKRQLANVGVARISTGSLLYRVAITSAVAAATAVRDDAPTPPAVSYDDIQRLHTRPQGS